MLQSPPRICGHPDHSVRRAARIELRSMGCTIWALRAEHKALRNVLLRRERQVPARRWTKARPAMPTLCGPCMRVRGSRCVWCVRGPCPVI